MAAVQAESRLLATCLVPDLSRILRGTITLSAFESDATLVRVHARFGCALGKPVGPDGSTPIEPFTAAKWTE
jgi:hypothetical protein